MLDPHILRLRRTDETNQHLLVHVTSHGSKELDLKLIGTEHEHLYHGQIHDKSIAKLQAANYSGSPDEWRAILRYCLLQARPSDAASEKDPDAEQDSLDPTEGLEAVAAIHASTLTLTLRKSISGITQRLGTIALQLDDEREAVSPFDWADAAVARVDAVRRELEGLQAGLVAQKAEVTRLNVLLDELVVAKREQEDEMLRKFAGLLNAKKGRIREQLRLLKGVDGGEGRKAGTSREAKRKVEEASVDGGEDEEEVGFDDRKEAGSETVETPPPSDGEATEDEEEDDDPPSRNLRSGSQAPPARPDKMDVDGDEALPPKRDLPFGNKLPRPTKAPSPPGRTNEVGDETDDDEL